MRRYGAQSSNGHQMKTGDKFCSEWCGPRASRVRRRTGAEVFERLKQRYSWQDFRNHLKPDLLYRPKRTPTVALELTSKQPHKKRWIIGAVVGLALVAELVATNGHGWESSWWGTSSPPSAQADSPLDVCGQNLINWLNYSSGHSLYVVETFGEQSGIPAWIINEAGVFQQQATEHGEAAANNKVDGDIAQECVSLTEHGTNISNLPTPPRKGQ